MKWPLVNQYHTASTATVCLDSFHRKHKVSGKTASMIDWVAPCSLPCSSVTKRQDIITLYSSKLTQWPLCGLNPCLYASLLPSPQVVGRGTYSARLIFYYNCVSPKCAWGCFSNTSKCPVMSFVCGTNNTTMNDVEPIAYPLSLWLLLGPWFLCRYFPRCWISKMTVLIFGKESLSWHHWLTNQWHTVCWHYIFRSTQLTWNPSQASTKRVHGTRCYH